MDMVTVVTPGFVILNVSLPDWLFTIEAIPGITNQTSSGPTPSPTTTLSFAGGRFYPEDCDA